MIHSTCEQNMEDVVVAAEQIVNVNNLGNVKINMHIKKENWKKEKEWLERQAC